MTLVFVFPLLTHEVLPTGRYKGAFIAHIVLTIVTLVLILRLLWLCYRKSKQLTCDGMTFFKYLQASIGVLGLFCLSDLCEYVSILDPMKPPDLDPDILRYYPESIPESTMGSTLNGQPRFGRDMAGPAKTFSYLTDGLIFLILFRIGLTINTPQPGSKNRRSRVIMILPETVLFMLLVLGLAYIGYVCDSVSLNLRNIYNFGHRDTALRIDIACSILVLGLACSVFTYAVATALKRHHGFSVQKFSSSQVLCVQCSALWIVRAVFYTIFVCISYRQSRVDFLDVCDTFGSGSPCGLVLVPVWYLYFLNVVFVTWPAYLILHLLMARFDPDEMGEFFVKKDDVEFDTVSIASSDYS